MIESGVEKEVADKLETLGQGVDEWNRWRRHGGAHQLLLEQIDLSESELAGVDFSGVNAMGAEFFGSDLSGANLKMSNFDKTDFSQANLGSIGAYKVGFENAYLVEANLEGADLSEGNLRGADLRGANLRDADLQGADLQGARLDRTDLTGASLAGANVSGASFSYANFDNANLTAMIYGGYRKMTGLYFGVRGLENSYGNAMFVRDARDQDYIDTLDRTIDRLPEGSLKTFERRLFRAWALIDYGRSLFKVTFYAFLLAFLYACIYSLDMNLGWGMMDYSSSANSWFTPFYYSIVTYTTLGFGDVTANHWIGEILVISEVIVGYFTLGLLLAILANTIARRS